MSENCPKRESCDAAVYCIDNLISDLRYVAELPSTDAIDAELLTKAADQMENAKKQVASDQKIIEAQARTIAQLSGGCKNCNDQLCDAFVRQWNERADLQQELQVARAMDSDKAQEWQEAMERLRGKA